MNERSLRKELVDFLGNHRKEIVSSWADGVMRIKGFKASEKVSRETHIQAMSDFFPLMLEHIRDRKKRDHLQFLKGLTQRGFLAGFGPSEVLKGHLVLKRVIFSLFNETYSHKGKKLDQFRSILEGEIEGHLETIIESYHQASEERWKASQKEIQETKSFLENILKSSIDGITTLDRKGFITFHSRGTENIVGYRQEELIGNHISNYYAGGIEESKKIMKGLKKEGQSQNYETVLLAKDGRKVPISLSASLLRDEKGEVIGTLGIYRDMTEVKRAEEEIRRRGQELSALNAIVVSMIQSHSQQDVMDEALEKVLEITHMDGAIIRLLDEAQGELAMIARKGFQGFSSDYLEKMTRIKVDGSLSGQAVLSGEPLVIEDLSKDRFSYFTRKTMLKEGIRFIASFPLRSKDRIHGVLNVVNRTPTRFAPQDVQLLNSISYQIGVAIESARLYEEAQNRRQEAETLNKIDMEISSTLDLKEVIGLIVENARNLLKTDMAFIAPLNEETGAARIIASVGTRTKAFDNIDIYPGRGIGGKVLLTGEPFITHDYLNDDRISHEYDAPARAEGFVGNMSIPIKSKGRVIGVLWVVTRSERYFTKQDQDIAVKLANQAATAIENARLYEAEQKRAEEASAVLEIAQSVASNLKLKQVLKILAQRTAQTVGARRCSINLWRDGRFVPVMSQFADGHKDLALWSKYKAMKAYRMEEVPAHSEAIRSKRPVIIEDAVTSNLFPPYWIKVWGIRSALVVPLIQQDKVFGTLTLDQTEGPYQWRQAQIELAMTIANQAALAIENARLYQELKESEERYRTILESIEEGYYEVDIAGNFTFLNDSLCKIVGYTKDELIGMNNRQYMDKEDAKKVYQIFNNMYTTGKPVKGFDWVFVRKDGTKRDLEVSVSLIRDAKGEGIGFRGIVRDVTERRQMEAELIRAKDFLQNIYDSSIDGIASTDLKGYITHISPRMRNMMGYEQKEVIGKRVYSFYGNGIEDAKRIMKELTAKAELRNHEMKLIKKDGGLIDIDLSASFLKDEKGEVTGILGIFKDITEKKILEAQLGQAQKMEAIGTLAGGIAHNFNNLLMAIQGNASLMLLGTNSTHPNYERLKSIEKSVQSGSRLTSQLVGYAREGRYEVKSVSLNELVRETSDTLGMTRKEIKVHQELAEDLFGIKADQGQIEQVLLNLYVNAADAMHAGGDLFLKTMNVTDRDISGRPFEVRPGNYVLLSVRDTGVGMDKETMKRIFDPFFTTKGLGNGTGLGLASVYGIVKAHGGYIDVVSEKGQGTSFEIYLPASEKQVTKEKQLATEVLKGKETVFLVDDEDMIIDVGEQILNTLGYEVLSATSGKEAVEIYKGNKDKIDMVLLDMIMPGMGGGETYDILKRINPDIKVLLSSGYAIEGKATEILERGCDGFIQKPFGMRQLSEKIREILDRQ